MTNQLRINSDRLRHYRLEHKLTQADISEKLNIHQTTYSKFENGRTYIKLDTLLTVSNILNIPPDELIIHEKGLFNSGHTSLAPHINTEIRQLITRLNTLLEMSATGI